jgi:hypothetical protein
MVAGAAQADQPIAERVVPYKKLVLTLQLSDAPTDTIDCKFGNHAARLLSAVAGDPGSTRRINLGCWLVNRDGSVEYSGVDQVTGNDIYIKLTTADFKTLPAFTSWGNYMGKFMVTSAP